MSKHKLIIMNIILADNNYHVQLLPITYTRPVAEIRIGVFTIKQRWELLLPGTYSYQTEDYLQPVFPTTIAENNLVIDATVVPTYKLIAKLSELKQGKLECNGKIIAAWCKSDEVKDAFNNTDFCEQYTDEVIRIANVWDIFSYAGELIKFDFSLVENKKKSALLSSTNTVIGNYPVFLEEGAVAECAIFNTQDGPIYLGKDSLVMEGSKIRGPFSLGEQGVLKMDAKIYGPTSIGPFCKVGGELNNVVMLGYSNKGHDGFLGNAVIGEWCNLGADTNNSNLKNNYAEVKLWSYEKESFVNTGLQFCGLIMGDHSKCGINTMFNTGTVVGVSANIFGAGFPRNFVPSFSWGGAHGFTLYRLDKALEVADRMMERRGLKMSEQEREVFGYIFEKCSQKH
jgi:UDP-N-acetylglucosamine diphosphorylase/glucosamine-1-phosphate N-acetyltransferase